MTPEERMQFYEARQRYQWQCEDFKERLFKKLDNYERKRNTLPKVRA